MNHQTYVQILYLFLACYLFTRGDNKHLIFYCKRLLVNTFLKREEIVRVKGHLRSGQAYTDRELLLDFIPKVRK